MSAVTLTRDERRERMAALRCACLHRPLRHRLEDFLDTMERREREGSLGLEGWCIGHRAAHHHKGCVCGRHDEETP